MTEEALQPASAAPEVVAEQAPQVEIPEVDAPEPETTEKPKAEAPKRSKSAREAVEKAFKADLKKDGEPKAPEPAKESTPKADDKPETAKEPAKAEPKTAEKPADKVEKDDKAAKPSAHDSAPSRFSADAKAEWQKAPEHVRAETHRAIREMERGIAEKDAALKPVEPFIKMAKDSGTTIDAALKAYVGMENALRDNPAQGLRKLAQNLGMTPDQMAAMLTNKQPGQPDPRDQQIQQLQGQLRQLESQFGQVSQTVQQQQTNNTQQMVEKFAADPKHSRFDELSEEIARLIQTGYATDLEDAYAKADRLNPAPPTEQPVPPPAPPAQTRQPRSLTGAPSPGSNPKTRGTPSKSAREALQRAWGA